MPKIDTVAKKTGAAIARTTDFTHSDNRHQRTVGTETRKVFLRGTRLPAAAADTLRESVIISSITDLCDVHRLICMHYL